MRYSIFSNSKYGNKKTVVDGIAFDSSKEARRYSELLMLQRVGDITDLERQKEYELIPAQYEDTDTGEVYKRGERKGKPKTKSVCIEHSVCYVADFCYKNKDGLTVVEDVKSPATRKKESYIIKRKLMLFVKGIRIKEV